MSTSFLPESIQLIEPLSNITPRVLKMIQELEEISLKLSRHLDKLNKRKNTSHSAINSATTEETSTATTTTIKKNVDHIEEIQVVKRAINSIFHKKNALIMSCYDLIDQKVKYIDQMSQSVEELIQFSSSLSSTPRLPKKSYQSLIISSSNSDRVMKRARSSSDIQIQEEPLYCICNQVSFGDMIACDNDQCSIEWFHYSCVGIEVEPSEWLCSECQKKKSEVVFEDVKI